MRWRRFTLLEINRGDRWRSKREHCSPILVGHHHVSCANNVHTDQEIATFEFAKCDRHEREAGVVWKFDVHKKHWT